MKRYTVDRKGIVLVFSVGIIGAVLSLYLLVQENAGTFSVFIKSTLIAVIPVVIGLILLTMFSYAKIHGATLRYMYFLYQRRTIDINSITDINDQPTYKVAKSQFRSLYVFYKDKDGETKWIEFRITIFPEKTLGKLIKDLKAINPRIELNKYSQKLMDSASEHKK